MMAPQTLPFWLAGLGFYFFSRRAAAFRMFGWAFVLTIAFFMAMHGKDYYSAPAYRHVCSRRERLRRKCSSIRPDSKNFRNSVPGSYEVRRFGAPAAVSLVLLPFVLPVLPIEKFVAYQKFIGIEPSRTEKNQIGVLLPQYYADEFGWQEMVEQVARVYHSLPPGPAGKGLRFTPRITARQVRSIFLVRAMGCQRRSARTRIIFYGDRANTLAKS